MEPWARTATGKGYLVVGSTIIGTIIAKNYLAAARVLARSIRQQHPQLRVVVLLVDEIEGCFDPASEPFETWVASDLRIPNWLHMASKYEVTELCTATKPFFLQRLLEQEGVCKAIYFDPDIALYNRLDNLLELLDSQLVVVTPHILEPLYDHCQPSEVDLLRAGIYNLGFIALSNHGDWRGLLRWWQTRLYDGCYNDPANGLFVDQRWCDLIPALFSPVHILRDPGYNAAYWNLSMRTIAPTSDGGYAVNGVPLVFFHFSGLQSGNPEGVSKHQNRLLLSQTTPSTQRLFADYLSRLMAEGHERSSLWPYSYGKSPQGTVISHSSRRVLRAEDPLGCKNPNPFCFSDATCGPPHSPDALDSKPVAAPEVRTPVPQERVDVVYHTVERAAQMVGMGQLFSSANRLPAIAALRKAIRRQLSPAPDPAAFPVPSPAQPSNPALVPNAPSVTVSTDRGELGVNIIGYLRSESGVGQAARNIALGLRSIGCPMAMHDLVVDDPARKQHDLEGDFDDQLPPDGIHYGVNLFCVNADMTLNTFGSLGHAAYMGRRNVGLWFWELSDFPARWRDCFSIYHEIWAASRFAQKAIATRSPIPVRYVPLTIRVRLPEVVRRADFGLPEDQKVFLYVLDARSHLERKNPLAVIQAFRRAFSSRERRDKVKLVMKVNNLAESPKEAILLRRSLAEVDGILIDRYLDRLSTNALIATCDSYVSLHRSEGFGLTIAEAMALGKPAIATDYSGNTDFMEEANSFPVPYNLKSIEVPDPPYDEGCTWAEPDVDAAATAMRRIVEQPDDARVRGLKAAQTIERMYNPLTVGNAIKGHLQRLEVEKSQTPFRHGSETLIDLTSASALRSRRTLTPSSTLAASSPAGGSSAFSTRQRHRPSG